MKAEAEALLQKAYASQRAAELLEREGYLDFAASRLYYAMFYATEALLVERGLSLEFLAVVEALLSAGST